MTETYQQYYTRKIEECLTLSNKALLEGDESLVKYYESEYDNYKKALSYLK